MATWEPIPGETPVDPSFLRDRESITNRAELAEAEARSINAVVRKYLAAKPSRRSAPFDFGWLLKLHDEMFGPVWTWGGRIRAVGKNIGVPPADIVNQLATLLGDLACWSEHGESIESQAVRLHHRAVWIHPFENGNGRWGRLLANIWLKLNGRPIVAWPDELLGKASVVREEYLAALKAADKGDFVPLTELHERLLEDQ